MQASQRCDDPLALTHSRVVIPVRGAYLGICPPLYARVGGSNCGAFILLLGRMSGMVAAAAISEKVLRRLWALWGGRATKGG